ncbi:MAG: M6 family metalloprotease domain-containing protein [Bacteroidales bacterium]|jgi:M6 family metalloprotease-like protein|nr:M6 family metalloprotease domain-containing protein [Bacteroidales bacterium]
MKNKLLKLLLLGAMLISQTMFAVPAKQGVLTITQLDGTTIDVYLSGDERISWYKTTDNYTLLVNEQGILEYAMLNSKNELVPSGTKAHNEGERSIAETVVLTTISKNLDYSPSQKAMMKEIASKVFDNDKEQAKAQGVEGVTIGRRKALIILVEYTDVPFTYTKQDFDNLFNQVNYSIGGAAGSVRDYFLASSFGKLELEPTVVGIYTLPHNRAFYGAHTASGNDANARQMIIDACTAADPDVDFAQFDGNNDGSVDGVHVIYAGLGEASGGSPETIWPHRGHLNPPQSFDGVSVSDYSCSAEKRNSYTIAGIGTIAHELGHVLGLLDYYDTEYNGTHTVGIFDIMDNGSYNNNENTPPLYCAFSRVALGWVEPYVLEADMNMDITALPIIDTNEVFIIKTPTAGDYFIFENKERDNPWDMMMYNGGNYNGGLLVMHVNENVGNWTLGGNNINTNPAHPGLRIVRADGVESGALNSQNSWVSTYVDNDVYPSFPSFNPPVTSFAANDGAEPATTTHSILDAVALVSNITRLANGTITFTVGQGATFANETTTLPATNIANTSATLNGNVISNSQSGSQTVVEQGFVYSTTPYPTINQATATKIPVASPTNMTHDITGLSEGENYFYRAFSVNAEGTTYGAQETFLTLSPVISDNFIVDSNFAACVTGEVPTIIGSTPQGGKGTYKYNWLQSTDNVAYTHTDNAGNKKDYTPGRMTAPLYFKRIVSSADKVDTSAAKYVPIVTATIEGSVMAQDDTISRGNTAVITISGQDGNIMFWQRKQDEAQWANLAESASVTTYNDVPTANGTYQYRARVQNGACPGKVTQAVSVVVVDSVGLSDIDNEAIAFDVYPNPSNGEFTLTFNEQQGSIDMNIIDMLGRLVYRREAVKSNQKIDISNIGQGTFFVILQSNGKTIGKRQIANKK